MNKHIPFMNIHESTLENIGIGVAFIFMMIVTSIIHPELLPLSVVLSFIILSPLLLVLNKTKYGYKHKWVIILLCIIIIIIHIIITKMIYN